MWYGYSAQTSAEVVISLHQHTVCVCIFIIIALIPSCQVCVEHLANWLSHTLALSANRYFVNEYSREIFPLFAFVVHYLWTKYANRERQLAFLPHCLITFCACTYTETRHVFIEEENEFTHSPGCNRMPGICLWSGSFSGMVLQLLSPHLVQEKKRDPAWEKEERERSLIAPVCFMHPPPPPPRTPQKSTAWLIFCVINLTCLCLCAVVLVAVAIFVRSLVGGEEMDGSDREKEKRRKMDWQLEKVGWGGGSGGVVVVVVAESEGWSDRGDLTDRKRERGWGVGGFICDIPCHHICRCLLKFAECSCAW